MSKIEKYTSFAEDIARDDTHGYDQIDRNGNPNYDCSGLVCDAVDRAGIPVKKAGASYTGNMLPAFKKCGFKDVTKEIILSSGKGLKRGDILLNTGHHTAIFCGSGKMVDARINEKGTATGGKSGDQTGHEIEIHAYKNHPWTNVLRYAGDDSSKEETKKEEKKTETKITASHKAKDSAQLFNKALSGSYKTTANLNMRHGAGTGKQVMVTLPKGTKAQCYGYYSKSGGVNWLYVVAVVNGVEYTGFCSSNYLKK